MGFIYMRPKTQEVTQFLPRKFSIPSNAYRVWALPGWRLRGRGGDEVASILTASCRVAKTGV